MYEIVTQGGGEILWKCLNAIAMLSKGGIFGTFIFIFLYIAVICYSYTVAVNQDIVGVSKKLAASLVIVAVMLAPTTRVLVTDKVTYFRKPVDHVPYLLALSAYVASNVGQAMAYEYDLSFQEPGFSRYTETGMNMYSSIIAKISEARLPSASQSLEMKNFVSQCLIYDLALGKYPLEELMNTPDPLRFITEHTSSQRGIILAQEGRKQLIPCNRALPKLMTGKKDYLAEYVMKAAAELFPGFKGAPEDLGRMLALSIGDAYSYLSNSAAEAEEILRINMLRNLIRDWQGDHDPAMAYALAHAEQNQGFSFKIMGKMAGNFLPVLKIIIEVLIIGIFPIVGVLSIMPGGIGILKKYLFMFFWVELWPVLFTILNMVFVTYARYRSGSLTEGGLSLGNISALAEVNDNISSFAGYAMILVPLLSFMVVRGAESIGQLATSMIGAIQSSVGSAAGEAATGSYRLNTVDVDSHNRHNDNGFKYDNNINYAKGGETWQKPGGELFKAFGDGSSSITSGAGINLSSGSRSLTMEDAIGSNLTEGYSQGLSAIQGLEQHFQQSKTATLRNTSDLVAHLAQRQAAGEALNIDTSTEEGKAMNQAINNTIALHDKEGYGWNQAAGATVKAHAGVEGSLFGVSGGVSTEGTVSANNTSEQSLDKENTITRTNDTNYNLGTLVKAANNHNWSQNDETGKTLSNSANASYEEMQNYGKVLSQRREEVENYNIALQAHRNKGTVDRRDMTHEVENNVMKQYGVPRAEAHKMVQTADPRAERVWNTMVHTETAKEIAQVKAAREHVDNIASRDSTFFENEHSGKVNNQGQIDLQKEAAKEGLDANLMNAKIQNTRDDIGNKQKDMTDNANIQIKSLEHHNKVMEHGMNDKINQYEKDRIGQGITSQLVGIAANIPTVGHGGDFNVGAPTTEQRGREYLQGENKVPQMPNTKSLKPTGEQE